MLFLPQLLKAGVFWLAVAVLYVFPSDSRAPPSKPPSFATSHVLMALKPLQLLSEVLDESGVASRVTPDMEIPVFESKCSARVPLRVTVVLARRTLANSNLLTPP